MSQELNQDELNALADLLVISQKAKAREALCIKIGISYYKELGFIYESSDYSFAINLINHLNDVGNTKAICNLCCKELSYIFHGERESFLKEVAGKLNCNQELRHNYSNPSIVEKPTSSISSPVPEFETNHPLQPDGSKPQSWLKIFSSVKYKLFTGVVLLLTGFTGFYLYEQNMSYPQEYAQLQSLLKDKDWKKADEETINKMRDVSGKKEGGLTLDDLKNYSCKDLRNIDKLWTESSNGKFGFSVQKRIWDEAGGGVQTKVENNQVLLNDFAQKVGWREAVTSLNNKVEYEQISPDKIRYDITAPNGHLPTLYGIGVWWYGVAPGGGIGGSALSLRLEQCNIR